MYDECADGSEVSQPDIAVTCDPKDSFPPGDPLLIRRSVYMKPLSINNSFQLFIMQKVY